jgi:hypothetical protein
MPEFDNPAAQGAPASASAPRHTTTSGLVGVFGLLCGLGAILGAVVTVVEWRENAAHERWPLASAQVERGAVDAELPGPRSSASTTWRLRYRVRFEVDGWEQHATLTSHPTGSEADAAKMQAWAGQHRRGASLELRYDPAHPEQAVFASADVPNSGPRTRTNLQLTFGTAIGCVVLLWLARFMAAREAPDAATRALSPAGKLVWGSLCAAMGILVIGLGFHSAARATHAITSEDFVFLPAGLMFVFGGVMLALPPERAALQRIFATLLVTAFALTLDWVAFGPGERHFTGGISIGINIGFNPGELFGRIAIGLCAVILDIMAAVMWTREIQRLLAGDP